MKVPSYFIDFLAEIRLTQNQINELKTGHKTLRTRLTDDEDLKEIIVSTFLHGSYKRSTAVRPKGESRSDADIIVVTKLDKDEYTPEEALNLFIPFLDKYYKDKYRIQGRSIGISLSYVDLDIVPTAAPSESEKGILEKNEASSDFTIDEMLEKYLLNESLSQRTELNSLRMFFEKISSDPQWKIDPLYIPDREAKKWTRTHPIEQIRWTIEKNKKCNSHYINVVKALKWWRKEKYPEVSQPKSYPLEHFIGQCCPDNIESVAEGVVSVLETIVTNYPIKPFLPDHGVPEHNVFARLTDQDYIEFYNTVCDAAVIAREAYDSDDLTESVNKWRELFGSKFPEPPEKKAINNSSQGFTARAEKTTEIPGGRFA